MDKKILTTPLTEEQVRSLKLGDVVYISGHIYTSRDMGHLRMKELVESGKPLPKDLNGGIIFHAGPVALKDEKGDWHLKAVGPTTSIRMEAYADFVGRLGVRAIMGKGGMDKGTEEACKKYGYVYLQGPPGCAAKLASGIEKINGVDWIDLGVPEAMWDFQANCFGPFVVTMDADSNSVYKQLKASGKEKIDELYPAE